MATTAKLLRANFPNWFLGTATRPIWGTNVKVALFNSSFTPTPDEAMGYTTTNELATEKGYTQGGEAIASPTCTYVAAASLDAWATGTVYNVGDCIKGSGDGAGKVYRCLVAGTSGATEPTWAGAVGERIQDNATAVYWGECGAGIVKLDCADLSWTVTGVITFRYAVFYDDSATQPASKPIICYVDFGTDQSSGSSGTLTLTIDALGQLVFPLY